MPDDEPDHDDSGQEDFWRDELQDTAQLFAMAASGDRTGVVKMLGEYILRTSIQNAKHKGRSTPSNATSNRKTSQEETASDKGHHGDDAEVADEHETEETTHEEEEDADEDYDGDYNEDFEEEYGEEDYDGDYDENYEQQLEGGEDEQYRGAQGLDEEYYAGDENFDQQQAEAYDDNGEYYEAGYGEEDEYYDDDQMPEKRVRWADEEGGAITEEQIYQDENGDYSNYDENGDYSNYDENGDYSNYDEDADYSNYDENGDYSNYAENEDYSNYDDNGDYSNYTENGDYSNYAIDDNVYDPNMQDDELPYMSGGLGNTQEGYDADYQPQQMLPYDGYGEESAGYYGDYGEDPESFHYDEEQYATDHGKPKLPIPQESESNTN
jgi:hypothetical protein